jgi:hypothetical protein
MTNNELTDILKLLYLMYILTRVCAMVEAATHRLLMAESWVQSQVSVCGICGGQGGSGTDFCLIILVFLCLHSTNFSCLSSNPSPVL